MLDAIPRTKCYTDSSPEATKSFTRARLFAPPTSNSQLPPGPFFPIVFALAYLSRKVLEEPAQRLRGLALALALALAGSGPRQSTK